MHEHGIAGDIVHAVIARRDAVKAGVVASVTLRVSELSGMTSEALQGALDQSCAEHGSAPFAVELVKDGLLGHCARCGEVVEADDALKCRRCGGGPVSLCGDETVLLVDCQFR